MRKRKVLAVFMAIAMVFCYIPTTAVADSVPGAFKDMPKEGFWSTAALEAAVDNGLLNGFVEKDGTYIKPNDPLTRAQMAAIVNRAFGAENKATLTGVADVASNAWYLGDMQKAVQMGTMKLDTLMRPNDSITRQEAFTILARAFKMTDGTATDLAGFSDGSKVASWAVPGMGALVKAGYVQGSDNMLTPTAQMTRAQFAVIMNNMIQDYITQAGTVTAVASGNVMVNVPGVTLKDVTIQGDLIVGDGVGDGDVTLDNVTIKGDLIARGGGVNSIVIVGGSVDGKIVIAKVDGQVRVSVEGGAEVEVIVIDDGKDDVIIEGTVGTVEVTAPDTPVIVQNATVTNIEIKSVGAANVTVASGSTVTNVVVGTGSTGTTLNVEGRVTNVETSAANTNVGGTGTVTTVTTNEGANNTSVTTPSTKVNNDGATGVTAGGGTEVPSGSTATNSNTGGEATVQPTTGGTTGGGGGGGTAPDTTAPTFHGVYPAVNSGQTIHWILAGDETFTFSVDAYDAGGLYELEIDHSLATTLPEFSVYADENNPYGTEDDREEFLDKGVTVTYSAAEMKWDIDFGTTITGIFVERGVTFYLVIKDVAGNQWGTMYGTTLENTFGYTFERANIVNRTQNTSHASIQAAIDVAEDDDTIQIGAGTYSTALTIGKSLTILGVNADNNAKTEAFLEAGSIVTGGIDITTGDVTIKGLTIQTKGILASNITGLTLENNRIENISEAMERSPGGSVIGLDVMTAATGPILVNQNSFSGIGIQDGTGTGVRIVKASNSITITNNIIEDVAKNGINIYNLIGSGVSIDISNNTIENWDSDQDSNNIGGRAIRVDLVEGATITVTDNTITPNYDTDRVDDEYVKITGVSTDNVNNLIGSLIDQNTWPSETDYGTVILVNTTAGTNMAASITSESTTNYYPTIQAAIDGAIEGDTIKLLADVITTVGTCYHVRESITIDLNGYEISGPANGSCSEGGSATHFFRVFSGTLTIDDTSDEKLGSISCTYSANSAAYTLEILAGAKVVLNEGKLTNSTPYNYGGSIVYMRGTAEFTMNGGTVDGVKVVDNKRTYPIYMKDATCKFTMTGGTVTSDSDPISYNGIVSISGGQLTGVAGATGLKPAYIADGSYCVFDGTKNTISTTVPTEYTANINGKLYYTAIGGGDLAIALAGNGDTVTLCGSTTANKTLGANNTLVITLGEGGSYGGEVSTTSLGYEVVTAVNGSTTTYSVELTADSAIAQWNGNYYPTAYAALNAAYEAGSTLKVILLKDSPAVTGIKGGILDLNGHKIEGSGSSGVLGLSSMNSDYSLTVIDSVGTGQVINTYANKSVVNAYYGTITIEAGTYIGNGTAAALTASAASGDKTAGTFVITGGTFSSDPSAYCAEGYEAIVSGGTWVVTEVE